MTPSCCWGHESLPSSLKCTSTAPVPGPSHPPFPPPAPPVPRSPAAGPLGSSRLLLKGPRETRDFGIRLNYAAVTAPTPRVQAQRRVISHTCYTSGVTARGLWSWFRGPGWQRPRLCLCFHGHNGGGSGKGCGEPHSGCAVPFESDACPHRSHFISQRKSRGSGRRTHDIGDQLTVTALLNPPVSADPARLECSSWQHSLPHVMFAP